MNPLNLMRRAEIKKALATITEDAEELKPEMDILIAGFGKSDPDGMKEVKQQLDAMNANKTGLEDVAAKAADALDAEVQKYHALQEQAETVDADELHTARMELRGNMTTEVREKIKDTFGKHYNADRFRQADREVSEILGEPHPQNDRSIVRKMQRPQEQSKHGHIRKMKRLVTPYPSDERKGCDMQLIQGLTIFAAIIPVKLRHPCS